MDGPVLQVTCPTCGRRMAYSTGNRWRPFCSERCRNVDLGAWASEQYRVASDSPTVDDTPGDDVPPAQ